MTDKITFSFTLTADEEGYVHLGNNTLIHIDLLRKHLEKGLSGSAIIENSRITGIELISTPASGSIV